ncbi:unnamed protein product [Arctia plantaginis]|uniref:Uncharacterized protein n=1 Tax=Arctia plantaginis TaxID=874455 RepID=A0A8S1APJ6_ARCPL|nr:unnamed protein product [Arctia plantaginis]
MIRRLDTALNPPAVFNGTVIPWSPVVKDLGLLIDSTLDWRTQVTHRVTKELSHTSTDFDPETIIYNEQNARCGVAQDLTSKSAKTNRQKFQTNTRDLLEDRRTLIL